MTSMRRSFSALPLFFFFYLALCAYGSPVRRAVAAPPSNDVCAGRVSAFTTGGGTDPGLPKFNLRKATAKTCFAPNANTQSPIASTLLAQGEALFFDFTEGASTSAPTTTTKASLTSAGTSTICDHILELNVLSAILTSVDGPCDQLIKDPKNAGKLQAMKDLINRINSRDNLAVVEESLESQKGGVVKFSQGFSDDLRPDKEATLGLDPKNTPSRLTASNDYLQATKGDANSGTIKVAADLDNIIKTSFPGTTGTVTDTWNSVLSTSASPPEDVVTSSSKTLSAADEAEELSEEKAADAEEATEAASTASVDDPDASSGGTACLLVARRNGKGPKRFARFKKTSKKVHTSRVVAEDPVVAEPVAEDPTTSSDDEPTSSSSSSSGGGISGFLKGIGSDIKGIFGGNKGSSTSSSDDDPTSVPAEEPATDPTDEEENPTTGACA